ncbi:glycosyltransferase family 87 protein [Streptomyces sp. NPDC001262]|uniref:glycosyltransferase family 87 protein n=1 Tax=unclassified Streptomyces TaxID=2593676 RepID=UPI0036BB3B7C
MSAPAAVPDPVAPLPEAGAVPASGDDFSRWLCARTSRPVSVAAVLLLALSTVRAYAKEAIGIDNDVVVRAARTLLEGGSPYADRRFLYLPGAAFAALPQTLLSERLLFYAVPAVTGLFVALSLMPALALFDVRADSRLAAALAAGTALFLPFHSIVSLGNWTVVSVAAFPLALLLARRGRWEAAAGVVGASIALKPMLVPVLLLFVLARKWRALIWAVTLPASVSLVAAVAMPRPELFFTRTLPFLLHGQDAYARPFDASWPAVLERVGMPHPVALGLAVVVSLVVLGCAAVRWRCGGEKGLRLVETASLLMLAAFLGSRPSFLNYALVVVPSLAASVVVRAAAVRSVWFWMVLVPQLGGVPWPGVESARRHAFKDIVMYTGMAAVLGLAACRTWRRKGGLVTVSGDGYSLCSDPAAGNRPEMR